MPATGCFGKKNSVRTDQDNAVTVPRLGSRSIRPNRNPGLPPGNDIYFDISNIAISQLGDFHSLLRLETQ